MNDFFELSELYIWPFLATLLCGLALSLMGVHITARKESMNVLVVNQVTVCLYLSFMFFAGLFFPNAEQDLFQIAVSVLSVAAGVFSLKKLEQHFRGRPDQMIAGQLVLFLGLLSASHLLASANPSFEGQVLRSMMGDVVLISDTTAQWLIFASAVVLLIAFQIRRDSLKRSFTRAILGVSETQVGQPLSAFTRFSEVVLISFLCLCTVELGFLFTSTVLLVPTQLMARVGGIGQKWHTFRVGALSASGVVLGFTASLVSSRVPTVPAIGVALFCISLAGLGVQLARHRLRWADNGS